MTDSVTFPASLGGNNKTITNDSNPTTGLDNDGHRRDDGSGFVGALGQVVVMAQTAVTGASNAAASAATASGAATTATTKAGEASVSASAAQVAAGSGDSWRYLFSTSTAEGSVSGQMRFNNATYTSVTSIFINEVSSDSLNLSTLINTLDDSTSTNKARLTVRSATTPTTFKVFTVTAVVDNGPYHTISVSPVAGGSGTFVNNDPVVVSYRLTGDKGDAGTAAASSVAFTPTGNIAATDAQAAIEELDAEKAKLSGGNTFSGTQTLSDGQLVRAMLKDVGAVYFDKGTVASGTVTFAYTDGSHQRLQVGGALTIAANAWPPTGNNGTILLELTNGGAFAITWPTINWIKSDGTTTTTFSNLGLTLQASGTDFILLWTRDAGTTIYGKVVR